MDTLKRLRSQWDRSAGVLLTVAGAIVLILGYFGASGEGLTAEQIPYIISGGLGGIFLLGVGASLWLSADLRDEWHKLDRIESVLENGLEQLGLGRGADDQPTLAPLARNDDAEPPKRPSRAATGTARSRGRVVRAGTTAAANGASLAVADEGGSGR